MRVEWRREAAVCVVGAAQGYPGHYQKGKKITGLEQLAGRPDVWAFHAGTRTGPAGEIRTAGGRVFGVTALGKDIADARRRAYEAIGQVSFPGMHYRRDIAAGAIEPTRNGNHV